MFKVILRALETLNEDEEDYFKNTVKQALGVDVNKVTIENRDDTGLRTEFIAKVGNKATPCYVTGSMGIVSDAICSGKSNALLDAAKARGY